MRLSLFRALGLLLLAELQVTHGQSWWANYKEGKPPEYLQPPWASAPGMEKTPLPAAPKPMPPPPPPPQGFQGTGRFYPPPPPPPPSPPPPLPPPPPAPAAQFSAYSPPASTTPNVIPPRFMSAPPPYVSVHPAYLARFKGQHEVLRRVFRRAHLGRFPIPYAARFMDTHAAGGSAGGHGGSGSTTGGGLHHHVHAAASQHRFASRSRTVLPSGHRRQPAGAAGAVGAAPSPAARSSRASRGPAGFHHHGAWLRRFAARERQLLLCRAHPVNRNLSLIFF